jgi:DNA-binding MarR family transcriptional regulator
MITKTLQETYVEVRHKYYYNFEYFYYLAIKQLLPEGLDLRDVVVLTTIESLQKSKKNTSTNIAQSINMSPSAFSNYLRTLEKYELVDRARGLENRKLMFITLTPQGVALIKIVKKFIQGFVRELIGQFGLKNSLLFLNAIIKSTQEDSKKTPPKLSVFSPQKAIQTISDGLRRVNLVFFVEEEQVYSKLTPPLSIREQRLLYEVYSMSQDSDVTPSVLGNQLGFAMSTITSMLKSLEQKNFIHRTSSKTDLRKFVLTLDPSALPSIELFMQTRIRLAEEATSKLDNQEQELLERSFQILREYSEKTIQK